MGIFCPLYEHMCTKFCVDFYIIGGGNVGKCLRGDILELIFFMSTTLAIVLHTGV